MVTMHVNNKNAGKPRVLAINALQAAYLLLLLQPSGLWLSLVTFNNDAKPPPKWLRGYPGLADWATRLVGSPHLSCKRDQIKP